jgi:hypothetical protein
MSYLLLLLIAFLLVTNYYYIDQFNKMYKDIKVIRNQIEEKKNK